MARKMDIVYKADGDVLDTIWIDDDEDIMDTLERWCDAYGWHIEDVKGMKY